MAPSGVVVCLDFILALVATWAAYSLRLETLHWHQGDEWLVYLLAPVLAIPIFIRFGVYRAAVYKHVPMVQCSPSEGVFNNVFGTLNMAQAAAANVASFVRVSTDKAVCPTNLMGASKRMAELVLQALVSQAEPGNTCFSMVRFGNVLGSSGSVVPCFGIS